MEAIRVLSMDVKRLHAPAESPSHAQLGQALLRDCLQVSEGIQTQVNQQQCMKVLLGVKN